MSEEIKQSITETTVTKKNHPLKSGAIFFQALVAIVLLVACASMYRSLVTQSSQLDSTKKDMQDQKDQMSYLSAQVNSLNEKISTYKKQADDLDHNVREEKATVDAVKKNYDALESKMNDLNQEFDDKFGRLSKEITDVKDVVAPIKEDLRDMKIVSQKWQKDYVSALNDLQNHVTRAAGLIAQMRDEMNKKIDFISMVQEKMIKETSPVAARADPTVRPLAAPSDEVIHRQILNRNLSEGMDKADYQVQNPSE